MPILADSLRQGLRQAAQLMQQDSLPEALTVLKELRSEYPQDVMVLGLLASTYASLKMPQQAADCYQQVLQQDPNNALACFQYGLLQFQQQDFAQALSIWQPLAQVHSEFVCQYFIAQAYAQLGDTHRAKQFVHSSLNHMPPEHPLYAQASALHQQVESGDDDLDQPAR